MGVFKSYLTWVRLIACEKEFSKVMRLDVAENGSVVIDQPRGRSGQKLSTNPTCDLTGPETVLLLTAISRISIYLLLQKHSCQFANKTSCPKCSLIALNCENLSA